MTAMFEDHRGRLTAVAYGLTGSVMDAEDVVQDAYLRWVGVDHATVDNPAAFLTTVVTRLAIDRLRSARVRREQYVGPWLPEPVVTGFDDDPAAIVAEAEQLSLAFLTTLERLNPLERAVFVLRTVFDADYAEIAEFVGRSAEACRQIASRARDRVQDPARHHRTGDEAALLDAFRAALESGDESSLRTLLAADVISWSDGGPHRRAARHPIMGRDRVAHFLTGIASKGREVDGRVEPARVNGDPGLAMYVDGGFWGVIALEAADEGIVGIRIVISPDKLGHLTG